MALGKKKPKELSIKQKVMAIKQNESEGKSKRELAKITVKAVKAKPKYRTHFLLERDVVHLLIPLYEIEIGLYALRQKNNSRLF